MWRCSTTLTPHARALFACVLSWANRAVLLLVLMQSLIRRRLRRAEVEFRLAVEAVDERVVASQARMLWAKEHRAVRSVHIKRTSIIEPLGANVALPEQVDVSFGSDEVWVRGHGASSPAQQIFRKSVLPMGC